MYPAKTTNFRILIFFGKERFAPRRFVYYSTIRLWKNEDTEEKVQPQKNYVYYSGSFVFIVADQVKRRSVYFFFVAQLLN